MHTNFIKNPLLSVPFFLRSGFSCISVCIRFSSGISYCNLVSAIPSKIGRTPISDKHIGHKFSSNINFFCYELLFSLFNNCCLCFVDNTTFPNNTQLYIKTIPFFRKVTFKRFFAVIKASLILQRFSFRFILRAKPLQIPFLSTFPVALPVC